MTQDQKEGVYKCGQYAEFGRTDQILNRLRDNPDEITGLTPAQVVDYIKALLLAPCLPGGGGL